MSSDALCPLCKMPARRQFYVHPDERGGRPASGVQCERCGKYTIDRMAEAICCTDGFPDAHLISGVTREFTERGVTDYHVSRENLGDIKKMAPQGVAETADRLFETLARMGPRPGQIVKLAHPHDCVLAFCAEWEGFRYFYKYVHDLGYLQLAGGSLNNWQCTIMPQGWIELERRKAASLDSKKVFVAMAFDEDLRPIFSEAIEPAVAVCGYHPLRLDGVHFTGAVVDAAIGHIRESRFIVADMTRQKGGMCFEGGFAMGLGRPVVWTCHAEEMKSL